MFCVGVWRKIRAFGIQQEWRVSQRMFLKGCIGACNNHANGLKKMHFSNRNKDKQYTKYIQIWTFDLLVLLTLADLSDLKSDNLQYDTLVCWVAGTNDLSTKCLVFQALFFHNFSLCFYFCKFIEKIILRTSDPQSPSHLSQ